MQPVGDIYVAAAAIKPGEPGDPNAPVAEPDDPCGPDCMGWCLLDGAPCRPSTPQPDGDDGNDLQVFDDDLARAIDAPAAAAMQGAGYDISFLAVGEPCYRSRATGIWSRCVSVASQPAGTVLARTWDDLVGQVAAFHRARAHGCLTQWREANDRQRVEVLDG